jgi:hypothetical protein
VGKIKIGKGPKSFSRMNAERAEKRDATARFNGLTQSFTSRDELQAAHTASRYADPYTAPRDRSAEAAQRIAGAMRRARSGEQPDGSYIDHNGVRLSKAYRDNLNISKPNLPGKGEKGQRCNRSACQLPGAYWYNHSTMKHYCGTCADLINADGGKFRDSFLESLGHPLLILDPEFADKAEERI